MMIMMIMSLSTIPIQLVLCSRVVWIIVGPEPTSAATTVIGIRATQRVIIVVCGLYMLFVMIILIFVLGPAPQEGRPSTTVADPVPSLNRLKC